MSENPTINFDPKLDLILERDTKLTCEQIYEGWTNPKIITQWFTPAPWTTPHAEVDLRPGGKYRIVMQGPDGESFDGTGCVIEAIPNERFAWTSSMDPGFRPKRVAENTPESMVFTAFVSMTPQAGGTHYKVVVSHPDEATCTSHREMGFEQGWGAAFAQLEALLLG